MVVRATLDPADGSPHSNMHPFEHGARSSQRTRASSASFTVPALTCMAMKVVAANISSVEARHLSQVPKHLLRELWRLVRKDREWTMSDVRYWGVFVQFLINDWGFVDGDGPQVGMWCIKTQFTQTSPQPLLQILEPAISPTMVFITHLQLSEGVECSVRDIIALVKMVNLGVLEIIQPAGVTNAAEFPRVTDAVIREWASAESPFPVLRVLRIWGEDFTTFRSLQYLHKFPSLAIYDVAGNGSDWPKALSTPLSWTSKRRLWSTDLLEAIAGTYRCLDHENPAHGNQDLMTLTSSTRALAFQCRNLT
ncbi:hypothetical protein Micbo1qcDRAFT_206376 [Microdochium bolleyi]|uniref:Uncharacterized protein n=1 Tax=Microdochium bolleyi TaxID=196109 RepID=A0A136IWY9_9PEZI|nr:hypothetical protein Micbo1qcDRAFT_206376 [Microdochium bolleyi]